MQAAGCLNEVERWSGTDRDRYTVIGVAARLFLFARHVGGAGFLRTWGVHLAAWALVLSHGSLAGDWHALRAWLRAVGVCHAFFVSWFAFLAAVGCRSQYGRLTVAARQMPDDGAPPCGGPAKRGDSCR